MKLLKLVFKEFLETRLMWSENSRLKLQAVKIKAIFSGSTFPVFKDIRRSVLKGSVKTHGNMGPGSGVWGYFDVSFIRDYTLFSPLAVWGQTLFALLKYNLKIIFICR